MTSNVTMTNPNIYDYIERRRGSCLSFLDLKKEFLKNSMSNFTITLENRFEPVDYGKQITAMDVDPFGRLLMTAGRSGKIFFHNLLNFTGNPGYTCKLSSEINIPPVKSAPGRVYPSHISCLQWFPNDSGLFVCSTHDGFVRVYDTEHQEEVETYTFNSYIFHHQLNKNQPNLVAVADQSSKVTLIDLKTGKSTHMLKGHGSFILSCCWSPSESNILATGGQDSVIRLWDIRSAKECICIKSEDSGIKNIINGLNFTVDGRSLVAISQANQLHCIDLVSSKEPKCIKLGKVSSNFPKTVNPLIVGYIGFNICIAPYKNKLRIYSLEQEEPLNTLNGHYDDIQCCCFNKDRIEMYSGAKSQNLLFWTISHQFFTAKNGFLGSGVDDDDDDEEEDD